MEPFGGGDGGVPPCIGQTRVGVNSLLPLCGSPASGVAMHAFNPEPSPWTLARFTLNEDQFRWCLSELRLLLVAVWVRRDPPAKEYNTNNKMNAWFSLVSK